MKLAMIQDEMISFNKLDPAHLDRGLFFGDGVYEVIRSYNGRLFALEEHLERFARSMTEIGLHGISIDEVRSRINRAFIQFGRDNAKVYFHVTRGSEARNHIPNPGLAPNFFLTIDEAPDSTHDKDNGIAVSTFPDWRWKRCDIKSLNLLPNVMARMDAEKRGCSEAILVNDTGEITEGAASAFFAIANDTLVTRPLGREILPSITRKHVIEAAVRAGICCAERTLTTADAMQAQELFIAVTTKDIVPVVRFDTQSISDGLPGPHTRSLIHHFSNLIAESS